MPEYYNAEGYYCADYDTKYYDGYGYNFYNGNYGYYEYSRPPPPGIGKPWDITYFFQTFAGMIVCLIAFTITYYKCETKTPAPATSDN